MGTVTIGKVFTIPLPSGIKVRVRRPSLFSVLAKGRIPGDLTATVWAMINAKKDEDLIAGPDAIKSMAQMIDMYTEACLVQPKAAEVTDLTEDAEGVLTGTVRVDDLPDADKGRIMAFGQGNWKPEEEASATTRSALETFRDERGSADAPRSGQDVQPAAVTSGGHIE